MKRISHRCFNILPIVAFAVMIGILMTCDPRESSAQGLEIRLSWDHDAVQGVITEEYWVYAAAQSDPLEDAVPVKVLPTFGSTNHSVNLPYPANPTQYGVKAVSNSAGVESPMSQSITFKPGIQAPTNLQISVP